MEDLTIKELQERSHAMALGRGFWDDTGIREALPPSHKDAAVKLALVHSEVSEAVEEIREYPNGRPNGVIQGKPEGLGFELADIIIRVADLAEALKIDLNSHIKHKMKYNSIRPYKHGKAF